MRGIIVEAFSALTAEQVIARLDEARIANSRANDMHDVWEHPQLKARNRWRVWKRSGVPSRRCFLPVHGKKRSAWTRFRHSASTPSDPLGSRLYAGADREPARRKGGVSHVASNDIPFVPGNRPDRFDKALNSAPMPSFWTWRTPSIPRPRTRRGAVGAWLDSGHATDGRVLIRINDDTTPWYGGDCALLDRFRSVGIVLPKAERADQIAALPKGGIVVPLIETARGLRAVDEIAAADGVQRLAFGTLDFAADLDLSGDERGLIQPAMMIALASRCAEKAAPIAGFPGHRCRRRSAIWIRPRLRLHRQAVHPSPAGRRRPGGTGPTPANRTGRGA